MFFVKFLTQFSFVYLKIFTLFKRI